MTKNIVLLNVTNKIDPWKTQVEDMDLPPGFAMDVDNGTWYQPPVKDAKPFKVCDAIVATARVRDEYGHGWGRIVKFRTPERLLRTAYVADTLLFETAPRMAQELVCAGFHAETSKAANTSLKQLLNALNAPIYVYSRQSGWTRNPAGAEVFVLPSGEVIGGHGVMMRPDCEQPLCAPHGCLADWQNNVAKYGIGNSRLLLAMCVPLAAVLLYDTHMASGGFHLVGPSQIAKTTVLVAAGSIQGKPVPSPDGVMGSWSNTANAMEGVTARANDLGVLLDEMSQCPGQDVARVIYSIGNGAGKGRMNANSSMRAVHKWRTMVISTGEETAEDKMAQAGKRTNAGVDVRLANIPADAGCGHGVFEDLHGFESHRAFAKHLVKQSKQYYGWGLREYVRHYVAMRNADHDDTVRQINEMAEQWIATYVPADASHQVKSVANRFALVAVAGELASAMGVVPWAAGEAAKGIATCMLAWLENRGDLGMAEERKLILELKAFLQGHQFSHFVDSLQRPDRIVSHEIHGVRREVEGNTHDFFVFTGHLKQILPGRNTRMITKVLYDAGLLIRENGRSTNVWRLREAHRQGVGTPTYRISSKIFEYGEEE